jgi:flagellar FliL protein
MAAKPEAPPAAAAAAPADAAAAPKKSGGMMGTLIPVVVVIVLAPAISWAVAQFVIVPQLRKGLAAPAAEGEHAAPAEGEHAAAPAEHAPAKAEKGGHGKKGEAAAGAGNTYAFENIVVNLAGTMGTRYLKASFLVTGADPTLRGQFEANKPRMLDVTLNVLSSLTLSDLEEAGAKNIIREKLGAAYNQALGRKVAEQIYFSDFVVQ